MDSDVLVVLISCPPERAQALAQALVEARVAACVNVIDSMESVYRWKGAVSREAEALLIVKSTAGRFEALKQAVLKQHPYEIPEIIGLPVGAGHAPYLDWVVKSVS